MPSLKDLRNRIASVKATKKITKAMQMVAAAKLRRAQSAAEAARPYATRMEAVLANLAAALQGRVALGPRAGQPLRRLRSAAGAAPTGPCCARLEGFSLHANVAVRAHRRDQLEHLCRYLLRPPLARERLTESAHGQLLLSCRIRGQTAPRTCSERTMYRFLAEPAEGRERRDQLRHPVYAAPELLARRPNELWSWDITKLRG